MFQIEALPVANGDCLLLQWGEDSQHTMLIDGGPGQTYDNVKSRLLNLCTDANGHRPIDLLIITHIDNDHIAGIVRLLCDRELSLAPRDVWFNGWQQIRRTGTGDLGPSEGEWLGALLTRKGVAWNRAFSRHDRRRVEVPLTGRLPRTVVGGLEVVLLSPRASELDKLRTTWSDTIRSAGGIPGDIDAAVAKLSDKGWLVDPNMLGPKPDDSITNGSSIAFVASYGERRVLLTGDAHATILTESLRRLAVGSGGPPYPVDLFKVSHHGSKRNIDAPLLGAMSCKRFLVSTDGSQFRHPDAAAIDLIIDSVSGAELIFNYRSPTTTPWSHAADQSARGYTAKYPRGRSALAALDV